MFHWWMLLVVKLMSDAINWLSLIRSCQCLITHYTVQLQLQCRIPGTHSSENACIKSLVVENTSCWLHDGTPARSVVCVCDGVVIAVWASLRRVYTESCESILGRTWSIVTAAAYIATWRCSRASSSSSSQLDSDQSLATSCYQWLSQVWFTITIHTHC